MKILIIDDDWHIVKLFEIFLKKYETKSIQSGSEVMQVLDEFRPDAILLDLMLPDKDGINILKEIRQDERYKDVVVFIISAKIMGEMTKIDGANFVLAKPVKKAQLIEKLEEFGIKPS